MKIKKKLVSFLMAVSMLASIFMPMPVSAYDVPAEFDLPEGVTWYSNTNSDGQEYIPGENYILEASTAYKTSGNYSLHLSAPNEYSNVQIRVGLDLKEALSTTATYRVTGKAVRISEYGITAWWNNINLHYGTSLDAITEIGNVVCSDDYATKGFADFSFDVTPTSAATMLAFFTWQGNYYIDDMSCKVVNSDGTLGEELLVNGSFENIVSDDELPTGVSWYSNTNSAGESYIPGENYILEASTAYKTSGNYSLHLAAPTEYSNVQLRIGLDLKEALSTSSTYRVTGKAVRMSEYDITAWWDNVQLRYGTSLQSLTKVGAITCSDDYTTKGFADFSFDVTPTSAATMLVLYTWQGNYYIDDMSCKVINSDGTLGKELLVNGGFENFGDETEADDYDGIYADYDSSSVKYPAHWQGQFSSASSTMIAKDTFIASYDIDAHSGENSMLIQVKEQSSNGETYSISTDLIETTDSSKTYRVEFFQKGLGGETDKISGSIIKGDGTAIYSDGLIALYNTSTVDESGWRKYSYDFTGQELNSIGLQFSTSNSILIDDFKLYELDDNGNVTQEIEIANGDFEDYLDFNEAPSEASYNDNWHIRHQGPAGIIDDCVRYEDIGSGDYAMHVRYNETRAGSVYVEIENNISNGQLVSGKAYTVEYDIKASARGEENSVFFFPLKLWNYSQVFGISTASRQDGVTKSITLLDNGFKHVVKEFTSSVSGDAVFAMLLQAQTDMVIDNITVYASDDSSKTNLIGDGDFSGTVAVDKSGLEKVYVSQNEVDTAVVSWTNPPAGVESATIYVDGTEYTASIDLTSDAYNEIKISGLTLGETYKIKIAAVIGGVEKTYESTVTICEDSKEQTDYSKSLKVLAVGNSFSVDALEYLYQIAESYGIEEVKIGNLYIGGCSLSEHWNKASLDKADYTYYKNTTGTFTSSTSSIKNALADEDWDIIVMQQVSGLSGLADSYEPYLSKLKDYINENKTNPDAQLAWHMTWAYQNGASHADFPKYNNDQTTMYNSIVKAVKGEILPDSDFDYIIPSGTAVQNVRTNSYIGDNLTRDGYHLSYDYGRYIAGLTWFKTLTGFEIDNITYTPSGVTGAYIPIAKAAVNEAYENPFEITDLSNVIQMRECVYANDTCNTNWTLTFNGMSEVVEDYAHIEDMGDGNYAMHLRYYNDAAANVYARLYSKSGENLVSGKNYIVEFDVQYKEASADNSMVMFPFASWDWDTTISNVNVVNEFTMDENGWYHYKKELTSTESGQQNTNIIIQSKCDVFIDNIKVYAADDETKTNLVVDGDFQSTQNAELVYEKTFDTPQTYTELECELYYDNEADETNIISFEGEGGNGNVLKMFKTGLVLGDSITAMDVPTGWYKLNAVIDYGNGMSITVTLPNGGTMQRTEDDYFRSSTAVNKIEILSADGNYKNITVSTERPESELEKAKTEAEIVSITKSGSEVMGITELSANDETVINIDYVNNTGKEQDLTVIAAYYDTDERLLGVETVAEDVISDEITETTLTYDYTIGDFGSADRMVFYAWDSMGGMKPLGEKYLVGDTKFSDTQLYHVTTTFYGDEGTTRGFAWSTVTEHDDMVIQYAQSGQNWNTSMIEKAATYEEYNSINFHKADIDGLEPGKTYVYRVGDTVDNLWSDYYTFTTEPENVESFSFIGITDTQSGAWEDGFEYMQDSLDEAFEDAPDAAFTVNLGDLTDAGTSRTQYRLYFDAAEGYAESVPHMAVAGNHCVNGDETSAGKLFQLHFNNPTNGYNALGDLTVDDVTNATTKGVINNFEGTAYSFEYGDAHFAVLNSGPFSYDEAITLLDKQAEWLREDLNASDKKWKIVMVHQGLYPALERYSTKSALLDVIDECGVDLVLHGHDHMVTRTYPMRNDEIVTKENTGIIEKGTGTVYNILGCGGPKRYSEALNTKEYAAVLTSTISSQPTYSIFNVDSDSIDVVTKQINGTIIDTYTIVDSEN